MDSSRLPGKALLNAGGRPLLEYALSLCNKIDELDSIAIATSDRAVDDSLEDFAKLHQIPCIRGSLDNVADRFLLAMKTLNLDAAVRINGDSPLNNKDLITHGIKIFKKGKIGENYNIGSGINISNLFRSLYSWLHYLDGSLKNNKTVKNRIFRRLARLILMTAPPL